MINSPQIIQSHWRLFRILFFHISSRSCWKKPMLVGVTTLLSEIRWERQGWLCGDTLALRGNCYGICELVSQCFTTLFLSFNNVTDVSGLGCYSTAAAFRKYLLSGTHPLRLQCLLRERQQQCMCLNRATTVNACQRAIRNSEMAEFLPQWSHSPVTRFIGPSALDMWYLLKGLWRKGNVLIPEVERRTTAQRAEAGYPVVCNMRKKKERVRVRLWHRKLPHVSLEWLEWKCNKCETILHSQFEWRLLSNIHMLCSLGCVRRLVSNLVITGMFYAFLCWACSASTDPNVLGSCPVGDKLTYIDWTIYSVRWNNTHALMS